MVHLRRLFTLNSDTSFSQNQVKNKEVLVLKMKDKKFSWVLMLGG